jgi:hypothetical protein
MFRRLGCLWVAAGLTLAAAPAHANHIPGATYSGPTAMGGTVSFDVSSQGGSIRRFAWTGVPTDCGTTTGTSTGSFEGSIPILSDPSLGHVFSQARGYRVLFDGSFPANQQAEGTFGTGPRQALPGGCTFFVRWNATTTAIAPPHPTDQIPPLVDVRIGNRLGGDRVIRVRVESPEEACTVVVGGTVSIAGPRGRTFRVRRVKTLVPHGGREVLQPKLGRRALETAIRALRNGRSVEQKVVLVAVDAAGNRTVERATIGLRR